MSKPSPCPVCLMDGVKLLGTHDSNERRLFSCEGCGQFVVTGTAINQLERSAADGRKRMLLSHWLRKAQRVDQMPLLCAETLNKVLATDRLPDPDEQCDLLIELLATRSKAPGEGASIHGLNDRAIVGALTPNTIHFLLASLKGKGLIAGQESGNGGGTFYLTLEGWERHRALVRGTPSGRVAFMAMKFGDPALDRVVDQHVRPAVRQTGFDPRRLDDRPQAGLIDDLLRVAIRGARFLIVDLTHDNSGAYWEAGFAEGLGKPVIYICEAEKFRTKSTHFDTNHMTTVPWSEADIGTSMERLKATIRWSIPEAKQVDD